MAEGMLRSMVKERDDVEVGSAGTAGIDGMPATREAVAVSIEHGVDISLHRSRGLTEELLTDADLVFALADHHLTAITEMDAGARKKSYLLSEFADGSQEDVPDPIGAGEDEYERVYGMLERFLSASLGRILMLAERKAARAGA